MQCCDPDDECAFIVDIIDSINKLLPFIPGDNYGDKMFSNLRYDLEAKQTKTSTLTLEGTMMVYYYLVHNQVYPTNPTRVEIARINEIWQAMGYSQNIIRI
jgi:hypothetical protein